MNKRIKKRQRLKGFSSCRRVRLYVLIASVSSAVYATAAAEEIAPFRLTGVEGNVELRYLYDKNDNVDAAGVRSGYQVRPTFEQEIFVLTHSYIYHPNFLKLDLGGGPIFSQSDFVFLNAATGMNETRAFNDEEFNVQARASFLEKKPYPLVLYYDESHPIVYPGLAERLLQDNTRYGLNFSIRQPVLPFQVNVEASSEDLQGDSSVLYVDDKVDRANVRIYTPLGGSDYVQLGHELTDRKALIGSPDILFPVVIDPANPPPTPVLEEVGISSLESVNSFGDGDRIRLSNFISFTEDTASYPREETRFRPFLRIQHTDQLQSNYRYNYFDSRRERRNNLSDLSSPTTRILDLTTQSAVAEIVYQIQENLHTDGNIHASNTENTSYDGNGNEENVFKEDSVGITTNVRYVQPVPIGTLQLTAGLSYDEFDRESGDTGIANVIDEAVVLVGVARVSLERANLVEDENRRMITVRSADQQNLTYTEGEDYVLSSLGSGITTIQRVPTGRILDGQTVLVSYNFETGGTFAYRSIEQNYRANLELSPQVNAFLYLRDRNLSITEGVIDQIQLNSLQNAQLGVRVDFPLQRDLIVGADATLETQDEDLTPYDRMDYGAYAQLPLFTAAHARLSARATQVEFDRSRGGEDIELTRLSAQLRARVWERVLLTLESSFEEDTGGAVDRSTATHLLRAEWRLYKLSFSTEARFVDESQANASRERTLVYATLRRDF